MTNKHRVHVWTERPPESYSEYRWWLRERRKRVGRIIPKLSVYARDCSTMINLIDRMELFRMVPVFLNPTIARSQLVEARALFRKGDLRGMELWEEAMKWMKPDMKEDGR